MPDKHRFEPGGRTAVDAVGRPYRICAICGKSGRGRGHLAGAKLERPRVTAAELVVIREPAPPAAPDWRLFAAYHAAVHAEEVPDLDAGLTLALRTLTRELHYLLHLKPAERWPARADDAARPVSVGGVKHGNGSTVTMPRGIRDGRIRELVRAAVGQGFTSRLTGGGHLELQGPDGRRFSVSMSARGSEAHGYANARSAARRAGVEVPV